MTVTPFEEGAPSTVIDAVESGTTQEDTSEAATPEQKARQQKQPLLLSTETTQHRQRVPLLQSAAADNPWIAPTVIPQPLVTACNPLVPAFPPVPVIAAPAPQPAIFPQITFRPKLTELTTKLKMEERNKFHIWSPYPPYHMYKPSKNNGYDNHKMPPSKVIHCRAVADGCKETDLVQVMRPYGNIRAITLMPKLRQALVEFDELEAAMSCVNNAQVAAILVLGRQMYVNYSKSTEINRDFSNSTATNVQTPTNILLFTIINAMHPVSVETIKKICSPHAEVQKIVIFHKNGLQVLVEFLTIEDGQRVQQALNGCDIFSGCCTLKIDFSKTGRLNVHTNTAETYDVEIEKRRRGAGSPLISPMTPASVPSLLSPNALAFTSQNKTIPMSGFHTIADAIHATGALQGNGTGLSESAMRALLAGSSGYPPVQSMFPVPWT